MRPVRFSSPGADGQAASGLHPATSPSPPPLLALTGSTVSPQLSQASCRTSALGQVLLPASTWDLGVLCLACNCCVLCKCQSLKKCGSSPSLPACFLLESLPSVFPVGLPTHSFVQTLSRNFPCVTLWAVSGDKDESTIPVLRDGIGNRIGQNDCFVPDTRGTSWMNSVVI